jgi:hypothetical protein
MASGLENVAPAVLDDMCMVEPLYSSLLIDSQKTVCNINNVYSILVN